MHAFRRAISGWYSEDLCFRARRIHCGFGVKGRMERSSLIILLFAAVLDAAWVSSLWRHWPERVYERNRDARFMWRWLSVFGIPRSEANCVRFMWVCFIAGMILMTLFSVVTACMLSTKQN